MDDYLSLTDFWFGFGFATLAIAVLYLVIMTLFTFARDFCFTLLRQLSKQAHYDQRPENEPLLGVARGNGSIKEQSVESSCSSEVALGNGSIEEQSVESSSSSDDRPDQEGEIDDTTLPKLPHSDYYYTEPQIQELVDRERAEPGYCRHVKDFVVGRRGFGSIKFLGETDVRGLDIESVIEINEWDVIVYMDDSGKPLFGQGPWKTAVATNLNLKCIDKKTGNQVFQGQRWQGYVQWLKNQANLPTYWGLEGLHQFTYQSLVDATQDFSLNCRMSFDCLGDVFRGKLSNTNEDIAIRRLKQYPVMSLKDFLDEVLLLSQATHPNLTKLIGYCGEKHNRLLVYEHVGRGTLENQLYGLNTCFGWDMRMKIALGVAKALEHLQNRMTPPILHYYIEPSNVWLDEEYTAKLSAFGLVRMFTSPLDKFGSYQYAVPDYKMTNKFTIEADICGFGIFLLEMITGKRGIFRGEDSSPQYLSDWAQPYLREKENMVEIVDTRLGGEFDHEKLYKVCDIIEKCLEKLPSSRPLIADIVEQISHLVT